MVRRVIPWVIAVLLTALYAYALVAPIGNLIGLPGMGFAIGLVGWFWLLVGVVLPPLAFVLAFLAGRGRPAMTRLTLLAAGLTVLALMQFQMVLLVPVTSYFV